MKIIQIIVLIIYWFIPFYYKMFAVLFDLQLLSFWHKKKERPRCMNKDVLSYQSGLD